MARDKTLFVCRECGGTSPKWLGKCPHCNAWNTLDEARAEPAGGKNRMQAMARGLNATQPVTTLSEIEASEVSRTPTGLEELDRVLGGGIVSGGVVLIGGDPGIGKSTLLLQALDALSRQMKVLYVTGEESGAQVALRAHRLGLDGSKVRVQAEIQLEHIIATLEAEQPSFCVIDHSGDTGLYFEGDPHSSFRLVRAIKNRFGAVNEIGVFAMTEKGLKGV